MSSSSKISRCRRLALGVTLLLGTGAASAFPCGIGYVDGNKTATPLTNDGTGNDFQCINGALNDNNDEAADLDGFFGKTGWTFYDRVNTPDTDGIGSNNILKISNLATSGSDILGGNWEFLLANFWSSFSDAVIVLKDGGVNVDPNCRGRCDSYFWSAYYVTSGEIDGNWAMDTRNLSHISLYTRAGTNPPPPPPPPRPDPIPEPGIISLLGAGLLGMRARLRRSASV